MIYCETCGLSLPGIDRLQTNGYRIAPCLRCPPPIKNRLLDVPYCQCGHAQQLHTPTGRLDDTDIRGQGTCAVNTCICDTYTERQR